MFDKWRERRRLKRITMPKQNVYCGDCGFWGGRSHKGNVMFIGAQDLYAAIANVRCMRECANPRRSQFPWWERLTRASDSCSIGKRAD